jgi:hypothetical protein
MRRGLLKVALADDVKASSSARSERHVVGVRFPALVKQARLENFRVMCINDGTVGLLEIATEVLKHPYLHFEPRLHIIVLHHLVEGRSNLGDLAFAKCSDGGVAPAFVITRGWKRAPPAVPYFAIAAPLNDCVYALMRESRETVLFE